MQDFVFVDETLDINITQSYYLSIQLSLNGLSFSILDPVRNKFIALVHKSFSDDLIFDDFLNAIEDYLAFNELLSSTYKNTKFIWVSNKNILIPSDYFNTENLKKHFEFNHKLDDLDEIHFKKLKYTDSYSVFNIPNQIATIFNRQFPGISFYNQQIPFIDNLVPTCHSEAEKIFVNLNIGFIDVSIAKKGTLLFYNNFECKADSDIIYFIMNVFDQFKLNKDHTELILSGFIAKKSNLYVRLKKFITQIKFTRPHDEFSYSYSFSSVPSHTFINLFNLQHCE